MDGILFSKMRRITFRWRTPRRSSLKFRISTTTRNVPHLGLTRAYSYTLLHGTPMPRLEIRDLLRPHRKALVLGLLAVIGDGLADLLQPWPLKIVIDHVVKGKELGG